MNSIETKEISNSLGALAKAKGKRMDQNVAVQPVAVMVETKDIPVVATPAQAPATPATPEASPTSAQVPEHDFKKRYTDLKTHYDTEVSDLRRKKDELERQLVQANTPKLELPKTKEEMELYRKQYPEAMDVFQTLALETFSVQSANLRDQLEQVKSVQAEIKEKEAFNRLLELHPDAVEIRSSEKFRVWYDDQPVAIQKILAESSDVKAVGKQLTLYKLEVLGLNPKEVKKAQVQSTIDASLGVPVSGHTEITSQKKIWTQSEINAVCADYKSFLKYRVEIDTARREGRVDLTK